MNKKFCIEKFNWQQLSIIDGKSQSCCKATEDSISIAQILDRPLGFFNYDQIIRDRKNMLEGHAISSCSHCWDLEKQGLISRRLENGSDRIDTSVTVDQCLPETLNLVIGNTCNMTCVYCCKKFSHSWRSDLINNGDYLAIADPNQRYQVSPRDQLMFKISQTQSRSSRFYQALISQLRDIATQIKHCIITGGEPFIIANLQEILDVFSNSDTKITIYTGLGLKPALLEKKLTALDPSKIKIVVSGENIGPLHEFSRFGSCFAEFEQNISSLRNLGFNPHFACSISNTTIYGIVDFLLHQGFAGDNQIIESIDTVCDPFFLSPHVIDAHSKDKLSDQFESYPNLAGLAAIMNTPCQDEHRIAAKNYLTQFAIRRKLSLSVFPTTFISWLMQ